MFSSDPSQYGDFLVSFLGILFEGLPYIFIGTLISGLIDVYLPSGLMDRLLPKNRYAAIGLSGLLGAVFPVCECAIVPVIRRLVQKGLPVSCAITYMLSAPIINPIVAYSTYRAFIGSPGPGGGPEPDPAFYVLSRIGIAYFVTVLVGVIVHQFSIRKILRPSVLRGLEAARPSTPQESLSGEVAPRAPQGRPDRLVAVFRTAARDFLDTGMYFTIGVLITALYRTQIDQSYVDRLGASDWIGVPTMMALAFILSLCSTSDAFLAAQSLSFSAAAKLAFLVFGPMMDVKLVFMYASVFRRRFVVLLALGLFLLIGLIFIRWGAIFPIRG